MLHRIGILACCFFVGLHLFAAAPPTPSPSVSDLIRRLGDDDFDVREEAFEQLSRREEAESALRRAAAGPDLEVARRARKLLAAFADRRAGRAALALKIDARAGHADLLTDRVVHWAGRDADADLWQPVLDLGWVFWDLRKRINWPPCVREGIDYRAWHRHRRQPEFTILPRTASVTLPGGDGRKSLLYAARGENVEALGSVGGSLLVASEKLRLGLATPTTELLANRLFAGGCWVFSNGPVQLRGASHSVIFSDSDVDVEYTLIGCVVIARGTVRCGPKTASCLIFAGGDVILPDGADYGRCAIRAGGAVRVGKGAEDRRKAALANNWQPTTIEQYDKHALAPVRLFEPSQVGIEVAPAKPAVRITTLQKDTVFTKAGLRLGDLIMEFDGQEVRSSDHFRRLLRRHVARDGYSELRIRRDGRWIDVLLPPLR